MIRSSRGSDKEETRRRQGGDIYDIGLYKGKCIKAIGKLIKTVLAEEMDGEIVFETESGDKITQVEMQRICKAIKDAETNFGYNLRTIQHRYFIVDQFITTEFKKASKNPIQKSKYFNLAEMLGYEQIPDVAQIANDLNEKNWEEFQNHINLQKSLKEGRECHLK